MSNNNNMLDISNVHTPKFFLNFSSHSLIGLTWLTVFFFLVGLYLSIFVAPTDEQQGEYYSMLYIHVPAAWISLFSYSILAIGSAFYLISKSPLTYYFCKTIANTGALFTLITLVTGSLWGAPMWGTYWVWDARLTSVLVLFFLYMGYLLIGNLYNDSLLGSNIASVVGLFGWINIPIVNFSVDWWNTLHQPASITATSSAIHGSMLVPLLIIFGAFSSYTLSIILMDLRTLLLSSNLNV